MPEVAVEQALGQHGLRATAQRTSLYKLMFEIRPEHFTVGQLHNFAAKHGSSVSLATVYNSIKAFELAGLVRNVAINSSLSIYDTRVEPHAHIYDEATGEIHDLGPSFLENLRIAVPDGHEISGVHLVFRMRVKTPLSS